MKRLVVNGCSYMYLHTEGGGHIDLGHQLNINNSVSIAIPGSCNTRILRTCLKDSYMTTDPTLYIVGLSFLSRTELPIKKTSDMFEGKWLNITSLPDPDADYEYGWGVQSVRSYIGIRLRAYNTSEQLEELMYQILSTVDSLTSRGHQIIVFRAPDDGYESLLMDTKFDLLKKSINVVGGLSWGSLAYQYDNGVKHDPADHALPRNIRHPAIGQYQVLNKFLFDYLQDNQLV